MTSRGSTMWSSADEELLMDLWQEHQILYNTMLTEYKRLDLKTAAITMIADTMGQPVSVIERKMRSLRTQYRRYKNCQASKNKLMGNRRPYLLKRLSFLAPFLKPSKSGQTSMEGDDEDYGYQEAEDEEFTQPANYSDVDYENDGDESEVSIETKAIKRQLEGSCVPHEDLLVKRPKIQPELELLKGVLEAYKKANVPVSAAPPPSSPPLQSSLLADQDESYVKYLVGELRYLPPSAKTWMKMKINQLLFEAQSGTYSSVAPSMSTSLAVSHSSRHNALNVTPVTVIPTPSAQGATPSSQNLPETMRVIRRNAGTNSVDMVSLPRAEVTKTDDVLIRVSFAGICGTDLQILSGDFPGVPNDLVLGHEVCGTVMEVGSNVTGLLIGQRVVINPMRSCGACIWCQKGEVRSCLNGSLAKEYGIFEDGGWAEFWVVPERQVVPLPAEIPPATSVLCEPISCVHQGWKNLGGVDESASILILGAGIIGQLWMALFHLKGYHDVTVCEMNPNRLALTKVAFPGYQTCHPDNLEGQVQTHDVIIDCTGSGMAIQAGLRLLKPHGILNIFGLTPEDETVLLKPIDLVLKNQKVMGTLIDSFSVPKSVTLARDLAGKGYLDFAQLGIRCYPFEDYKAAVSALESKTITKAVLHIDREVTFEQLETKSSHIEKDS